MITIFDDPRMVVINEDILNTLISTTQLTVKDLEALKPLPTQKAQNKTSKPDFKPNPHLGEGTASQTEWEYREKILSLLKTLYTDIQNIKTKEETHPYLRTSQENQLIDQFIQEGQELVKEHITKTYQEKHQLATEKLKKIGIKQRTPPTPSETMNLLIDYQTFSIKKIGETLRLQLENNDKLNNYFQAAYGTR